jgi:hypothetical protein
MSLGIKKVKKLHMLKEKKVTFDYRLDDHKWVVFVDGESVAFASNINDAKKKRWEIDKKENVRTCKYTKK